MFNIGCMRNTGPLHPAYHFGVVAGAARHRHGYGHSHRHPSCAEQDRGRDQLCGHRRQKASPLALPHRQLPGRQQELGAVLARREGRVSLGELRRSRGSDADSDTRHADPSDAAVVPPTAVSGGLRVVAVLLKTAAVAVNDEAEHARQLQEAVPLLLLPVVQFASPLFQAMTIFREKMAHIDDSTKLCETKTKTKIQVNFLEKILQGTIQTYNIYGTV